MKKILVPTDFSPNSLKSLEYVIETTKNIAVEIVLVWVNSIRSKDILVSESEEMSTQKAAPIELEKIISTYAPKLSKGSTMRYCIRQGKVHVEIANQAYRDDVDFVVCGTHGASGFEENYVGSNAYRIVMYCRCPVITVRPNYRFGASSKIFVLPIDSSLNTRQKASFTCIMAKITGSEIHILGLYSSKNKSARAKVDSYVRQVEKFFVEGGCKFTTTFTEAGNITKTTLAYAESVNADMVTIMTEQESSALSFLLGTYAEQMISSATMPVAAVTPKVLLKTSLS
jgi:nucleotide-binding universal stress UspA family protein